MEQKSNIVSLAYRREERVKKQPASSVAPTGITMAHEKRIAELEKKLAEVTAALAEVAEDTSLNRKHLLKLLKLLQAK